MTLRRKLVYLHIAFAAFAVTMAFATIYGVQLHVWSAAGSFEKLIDQSVLVENLRVAAQKQFVQLHEIIGGRKEISETYLARKDDFFTSLAEVASYADEHGEGTDWQSIKDLGRRLKDSSDRCLSLVRKSKIEEASAILNGRIESDLLVALDERLQRIRRTLDEARWRSGNDLLATNTQLLALAVVIGATGVGLVAVGAIVVRRWLITPIGELHAATREFGRGILTHRVKLDSEDELGSLGSSLNAMASSLTTSQTKYRTLFENLRDAVIICDAAGVVVECHDSDTELFGVVPEAAIGRHLLDVWPEWQSEHWDWNILIGRVATAGERIRTADMRLTRADRPAAVVDMVTYPVKYSNTRYAAIVLRDVTERNRLQRLARRSDTMEATLTFARGIAHDFKNLLTSAVATLSLIDAEKNSEKNRKRAQTALRACRHAAGLSRRLAEFGGGDQGHPEPLCLSETIELILSSLDEPLLTAVDIRTECDRSVRVSMDRDQLTQVVLNLLHNAREAMPDGGELRIAINTETTSNPVGRDVPSRYGVLTVSDNGLGMPDEVKEHIFVPFFTTKAGGLRASRGMGLAVAYAAVSNAGGFIQVESAVGVGTTFRVLLPEIRELKEGQPSFPPGSESKPDPDHSERRRPTDRV